MELVQYIRLFRRWLWLLLLAGFVGASWTFINSIRQPSTYQARSLISIGSYFNSPNPSTGAIGIGAALTATYEQLIRTRNVLEGALDSIGNPIPPEYLNAILFTFSIPETSFMEIYVTYTDPILAADMANALARQLIVQSPTNLTQEQQRQITLLNQQIDALTNEISDLRSSLADIDLQLTTEDLTSSRRVELQVERLTLIDQINVASNNVAQFSSTVADLQVRTNSVEIIEEARIPEGANPSFSMSSLIMGGVMAVGLVGGLIFIYEYFNSTFHSSDETAQILRQPVLASISKYGKGKDNYKQKLLTNLLKTRVPDEFRILRTNLLFSADVSHGIFVVTSATPNEGKTTIISNLAVSLAMSGLNVVLIDADLRKPQIHKVFSLNNDIGLTSLLKSNITNASPDEIREMVQNTVHPAGDIENLWVLPSGFPIDNPTELLGSTIMKNWIDIIQTNFSFDIILIDAPPLLGFPDSAVMSVSLGAKVIPVIRAGKTRHEAAKRMIARLDQVQAEVIGVILNQTNPRDENYQDYAYYVDYYSAAAE